MVGCITGKCRLKRRTSLARKTQSGRRAPEREFKRRQGRDLVSCNIDTISQNADNEAVEGVRQIGTLTAHALKIGAGQREESCWAVRAYSGRAHGVPKETHLADDCVRHNTSHAQAFSITLCDVDRKVARCDEIKRVGGLALTIKNL